MTNPEQTPEDGFNETSPLPPLAVGKASVTEAKAADYDEEGRDASALLIDHKAIEHIARVAHAVNDAYRSATGELARGPWESLPEDMRASTRNGVLHHLMNPGGINPEEAHNLWLGYKLKEGWRYGPKTILEEKVHECLLPYSQLPQVHRVKDYLFSAVVNAMRPASGDTP